MEFPRPHLPPIDRATRSVAARIDHTVRDVALETRRSLGAGGRAAGSGANAALDAATRSARLIGGLGRHPSRLVDALIRHDARRVVETDDRLHVEIRTHDDPGIDDVVERAVRQLGGVQHAVLHRPSGRLVIWFDGSRRRQEVLGELCGELDRIESEVGLGAFPQRDHPADDAPIVRDVVGIGADVVGISIGSVTQALRFRPPPIEIDIAAALNVADQVIPIRRAIERRLGPPLTDLTVSFTNAIVQGAIDGPVSPMVDLGRRVLIFRELAARRAVWTRREPVLFADPGDVASPPPGRPRPVALPNGPIERYERRAWAAGAGLGGAMMLLTRRLERAAAGVQAMMPKAARIGRDGYARELGHHFAARGVLLNEPSALQLLDRVTVVAVGVELTGPAGLDLSVLQRAAERHDIDVLVEAGAASALPDGVTPIPEGQLGDAIRDRQHDGDVVALVAADPGHPSADIVLGLHRELGVPWRAHLLGTDDAADVLLLLEAIVQARRVARESVRLAMVGAAGATVVALGDLVPGSAQRAPSVVSVCSAVALLNGVRHAFEVARRPLPVRTDPTPWHALDTTTALDRLGSSTIGLSTEAATARAVPEPRPPVLPVAFVEAVADELVNPLTPVLAGGALLSLIVGSVVDATLIGGVVFANAVVGGAQHVRAQRSLQTLTRVNRGDITVIRSGRTRRIAPPELVQGDVVRLLAGERVPADCRILDAVSVEVDEAALTGESVTVTKSADPVDTDSLAERRSMLYDGSWIAAGEATAVVVATGTATEARRALLLAGDAPTAGVEARLMTWTARMVPVALLGGGALLLNGFIRRRPTREILGASVSLAVAAVPEGLPLLSTVAQLAAARRLSDHNVLVRNPGAIEAMGRCDVVCADKTGTLTEGRITLRVVSDGVEEYPLEAAPPDVLGILRTGVHATPWVEDPDELAHPTDRAVARGAINSGASVAWEPDGELAFEPGRGYHAAAGIVGGDRQLAVKGAPEVVLPRCTRWRHDGATRTLTAADHSRLEATVERLARGGYRVLAVAHGDGNGHVDLDDEHVHDLEFDGLLGLADPARDSAAAAVRLLDRAGVRTLMITGDHPSTAEAIGAELGVLDDGVVITGEQIDNSDDDELGALLERNAVFARVTPSHKVRIVRALQHTGHTVAMTGDGANDAPAIRLADVGIALGGDATPAARNAADIVVLDERIETIVDAIVEGRALWGSVRDAVSVLVGGNLGEIVFTVLGSLLTGRPPLNARQLLLVNLLTDAAPALAIAARPPRAVTADQLLHEGPEESLATALDRAIAVRAVTTALASAGAWVVSAPLVAPRRASTVALVTTVGTQLAQTVMTSSRDPIVIVAGVTSAAALAAIVQTPGLSQLFGCTPLDPVGWAVASSSSTAGAVGAAVLPPMLGR